MIATTTLRAVTPDDLLAMPDGDRYELIDGRLKERDVSFRSSYVAGRVFRAVGDYCEANGAGWVCPEGVSYRCFPFDESRVRRADVSFIAAGRFTAEQFNTEGHCTVAPDLVVEVISTHDKAEDVDLKVEEWLAAGVKLVWLINPAARNVRVYGGDRPLTLLREPDTLTGNGVLPGLAVPVAGLFRVPG